MNVSTLKKNKGSSRTPGSWRSGSVLIGLLCSSLSVQAADPLASNNGWYPTADEWDKPMRMANLDYASAEVKNPWPPGGGQGPITIHNAQAYTEALKKYLAPTLKAMIEDPLGWSPAENGWYDLVWSGAGESNNSGTTDPNSGREVLLSTYSGQILPKETWKAPYTPTVDVQNHAVIYYNDAAATMLAKLWKNLYAPDLTAVDFPNGSIVVKAEAATPTTAQWPILEGAAQWNVFRPSVAAQQKRGGAVIPEVLALRALQMSIAVKDATASPQTGWVYVGFVYDKNAKGESPWDRFVPLGAQWGNDPEFALNEEGVDPNGGGLKETWVNPNAPGFVQQTLGWGGRLAGPMDVATRQNVLTPSGKRYQGANHLRASSCLSCHGAAEYPFTANLYPSPNKSFPLDGQPFLLYDPGSAEWAQWFQNRSGTRAMSDKGVIGLDYDMAIMFSLSNYDTAVGNDAFVQERFHVH